MMHRKTTFSSKWNRTTGDSLGRAQRPNMVGYAGTPNGKSAASRRNMVLASGTVQKDGYSDGKVGMVASNSHQKRIFAAQRRKALKDVSSSTASLLSPSSTLAAAASVSNSQVESPSCSLPTSACTRNYIPCQATFALSKFNNLLQFITPGSLVAFDIDDTLIKKRHFGCSLLTNEGAKQFSEYVQHHYKQNTFTERQQMVNRLYAELKEFALTELDTSQVVQALQARGAYVFGLTARASSLAYATSSSLLSHGIDLNAATPPSLPARALESATGAVVVDGIVYCNDTDKGVVLQRLLQLGWISWPNPKSKSTVSNAVDGKNNNKDDGSDNASTTMDSAHMSTASESKVDQSATKTQSSSTLPPELHEGSEDGRTCPERTIWFVDDSLQMILGMMQSWAAMTQAQKDFYASLGEYADQIPCRGKLSLVCCHYTHPEAAAAALTSGLDAKYKDQIIQVQIEEYLSTGQILTDTEALNRIEASPRILSQLGFAAMAAGREQAAVANVM